MELHDAFAELQLERGAPFEDVRRAYLALLKTRKPEVDPEGFKRLRQAYELASAFARFQDAQRARKGPGALPPRPAPDSPSPASPSGTATPPESQALSPPPAPPQNELRPLAAPVEKPPPVELDGSILKLRGEQPERVAAHLARFYQAASERLVPLAPPSFLTTDLATRLFAKRSFDSALALMQAFEGWLTATGLERRINGPAAVQLALARELAIICTDVYPELAALVASAMTHKDLARAQREIAQFAQLRGLALPPLVQQLRFKARLATQLIYPARRPAPAKPTNWRQAALISVMVIGLSSIFGGLQRAAHQFPAVSALFAPSSPPPPATLEDSLRDLALYPWPTAELHGRVEQVRADVLGMNCPAAMRDLVTLRAVVAGSADQPLQRSYANALDKLTTRCGSAHKAGAAP